MENPKIFNILILLMHLSMVCPKMGVGGGWATPGEFDFFEMKISNSPPLGAHKRSNFYTNLCN